MKTERLIRLLMTIKCPVTPAVTEHFYTQSPNTLQADAILKEMNTLPFHIRF